MDLRTTLERAQQAGWRKLARPGRRKRHDKWVSPDGKSVVVVGRTPSDYRAALNLRAEFRRAGLDI